MPLLEYVDLQLGYPHHYDDRPAQSLLAAMSVPCRATTGQAPVTMHSAVQGALMPVGGQMQPVGNRSMTDELPTMDPSG
jgi:hypothetical protein